MGSGSIDYSPTIHYGAQSRQIRGEQWHAYPDSSYLSNRSEILCADADYQFFQLECDKHACQLHAYVLMTNHLHFLITPQEEQNIGKAKLKGFAQSGPL